MQRVISRRNFLKALGVGAAAIGLSQFEAFRVSGQPVELKIIQWQHFVPAYDQWFDPFAQEWGQNRNPPVNVTVDHISFADILTRANAEVAAQEGHDLFFFLNPPPAFEEQVVDHTDLVLDTEQKHGLITPLALKSTFNPVTDKFFGFSPFFTIDPIDYHKDIWQAIGKPEGPRTWLELLEAGDEIRKQFPQVQIPIGIGYSNDIDSNMATRAILWSFDASIQDENENVVLNSEETLEALRFGVELFKRMDPAVLGWDAASNNRAFNAKQTSMILNSISAYRAAQLSNQALADNTFFTPALRGPRGTQLAAEHVMGVYVIWKFAKQQDLAKEFLAFLMDNQRDDVLNSKLYNTSSFLGALADPSVTDPAAKPASGREWLAAQFQNDPFGSNPPDKLNAFFETALDWSTNIGHPGPANPAEGEVFDNFLIPQMFAQAATGAKTPEQALADTNAQVKQIFNKWRQAGFVAGGSGDK